MSVVMANYLLSSRDLVCVQGSDGGLLTSVATWCSSLCGSKSNAAGEPRSIDFQAAAQNVAQVLHSSSAPTASSDAEPKPEEPKPADPE
jgi:hypothetical protein